MIKIDRLVLGLGRLAHQFVRRRLVEAELLLDDGVQLVALEVGNVAVDGGGMHKQRGRRQAIVVVLEADRMRAAFRRLGQKSAKTIEHATVSRWTAPRCTSFPQSLEAGAGCIDRATSARPRESGDPDHESQAGGSGFPLARE
jgi:hypothetical protein